MFIALSLAKYHLLFLDEPTNHLDLEGKEELAEELCQFKGGFILVTHDRELLEKSCNRFWLVDEG
ncbi:ABC transporter ATP-binding protein, partial [Alcaligenes pakistanensis]